MTYRTILSHQTESFLKYCKYQKRLSDATLKAYRFDLQDFLLFLDAKNLTSDFLDQVDRHLLSDYVNNLGERHFSTKTVKRRMACLRAFFHYLEYEEILPQTPFAKFRMELKDHPVPPPTMSLTEVNQILRTIYNEMPPLFSQHLPEFLTGQRTVHAGSREFLWLRNAAILEILFASGLRVGELCNLTFDDLDPAQHALRIHGKGGKIRTVYLCNNDVLHIFDQYLKVRLRCKSDVPYAFISKFRTQLSTQGVRNMIRRYTSDAGIPRHITPHMFRHSFASLLLEEGVDIKYIQEFLGHSSISTTQIYLHTTADTKKSILRNFHPREHLSATSSISIDNVKLSVKTGKPII